jgi:hypothetical protein
MMTRYERPRPRPRKAEPASQALSVDVRAKIAEDAIYIGSPHHTDVPKYGLQAQPREGHATVEKAEEDGLKNPSCLVCPRKWARRQNDATKLLQQAIKDGHFIPEGEENKPGRLWARDPDDAKIVYEAKLVQPPNGYKAYPLTAYQVEFNLPFELP